MILGIGVDVCEVERIRRALERPTGTRFRARVFTAGECRYCEARGRGRFASYAARFAAKEAGMKALGTGWARGITWHDFEVRRQPGAAPALALHGRAALLARRRGMTRWHLALSHTALGAVATVVVEGGRLRAAAAPGAPRRSGAAGGAARPRPRSRR